MALSAAARQRRPTLLSSSSDQDLSDRNYSKHEKKSKDETKGGVGGGDDEGRGISWVLPVLALGILRHMSASSNSVHDCDEVFNYWEPLHYVLYDSGFQTWEYSSQFALRSYLYIFFHTLVARPAAWFFNEEKVRVFYAVRLFSGSYLNYYRECLGRCPFKEVWKESWYLHACNVMLDEWCTQLDPSLVFEEDSADQLSLYEDIPLDDLE